MIFFKKIVPYISAALVAGLLELLFVWSDGWWILLLFLGFIVLITTFYLNHFKFDKNLLGFSVAPVMFALSSYLFLFFLESPMFEQIIIFLVFLGLAVFWANLVNFIWDKPRYQTYALENISSYLNLFSAFYIFVGSFNLYILGITRMRYLLAMVFIVALALSWQTFWINKVEHQSKRYFPFIFAIIFFELFWVMHYLPISYLVTGIILTAVFYTATNITRFHLLDNLNKKVVARYVVISLVVITSALLTASWT
ncbi:hypothetical protein KKC88_03135 [Patescibacteria group bacterium]|nr:hypothetical protein [Patescibacteria group bacterium]MBU1673416.1 hypothetical protein [Patescibacteria group bacterium]MBU1963320.1 hypothetical protein [Patescibacteria group bacterium]